MAPIALPEFAEDYRAQEEANCYLPDSKRMPVNCNRELANLNCALSDFNRVLIRNLGNDIEVGTDLGITIITFAPTCSAICANIYIVTLFIYKEPK